MSQLLLGVDVGGGGVRCVLADAETGRTTAVQHGLPTRRVDGIAMGLDLDVEAAWA